MSRQMSGEIQIKFLLANSQLLKQAKVNFFLIKTTNLFTIFKIVLFGRIIIARFQEMLKFDQILTFYMLVSGQNTV